MNINVEPTKSLNFDVNNLKCRIFIKSNGIENEREQWDQSFARFGIPYLSLKNAILDKRICWDKGKEEDLKVSDRYFGDVFHAEFFPVSSIGIIDHSGEERMIEYVRICGRTHAVVYTWRRGIARMITMYPLKENNITKRREKFVATYVDLHEESIRLITNNRCMVHIPIMSIGTEDKKAYLLFIDL